MLTQKKLEDEMGLETFHLFLPLPLPQAPGQVPCQAIKILPRPLCRLALPCPCPCQVYSHSIPGLKPCRPPTNPACQVSQQRHADQQPKKRQISKTQFNSIRFSCSIRLFRAPALAFQRCGELPPGPTPETGARRDNT